MEVFIKSKSARVDQCEKGAWGWMILGGPPGFNCWWENQWNLALKKDKTQQKLMLTPDT